MDLLELAAELDALGDVRDDAENVTLADLITTLEQLDVFDEAAVLDWTRDAAVSVRTAQDVVADVATEVARTIAEDITGEPAGTVTLSDYPRVANPLEEFQRPAVQGRYAAVTGNADTNAVTRLQQLVATDMAVAQREVMQETYRQAGVLYFRRIIHPELSRTGTCGLCVAAATRVYSVEDLMPIHDNCKCQAVGVYEGQDDPGLRLNRTELGRLYEEAGDTSAERLNRVRVHTVQHGELGQILVRTNIDGTEHWVDSRTRAELRSNKLRRYARQEYDALQARMAGPVFVQMSERERRWTIDRLRTLTEQLEGG